MSRTTVMLPLDLKRKTVALARSSGVSFGEFVRRALAAAAEGERQGRPRRDPLLEDHAVFRGRTPRDLSRNHDRYLYGE